jgi:hypothetical protein
LRLRRKTGCTGVWIECWKHKQRIVRTFTAALERSVRCGIRFIVIRLTSTYVEGEAEQNPKAKYGYSRDGRPDCKQVVIALVMTPAGLPLAYEVMDGNTSDKTTLRIFLDKIEGLYGKARRVWLMDRGIPTEALLQQMRTSRQETFYLVGTSRAKVKQYEHKWLELPWQKVRESVEVKLFARDGEVYVLAKSDGRQAKEIAMRRKKLTRLLRKLRAMRRSCPKRDQLLLRVDAAKTQAGRAFGFVTIHLPPAGQEVTRDTFTFQLDKAKLKEAERRVGGHEETFVFVRTAGFPRASGGSPAWK